MRGLPIKGVPSEVVDEDFEADEEEDDPAAELGPLPGQAAEERARSCSQGPK